MKNHYLSKFQYITEDGVLDSDDESAKVQLFFNFSGRSDLKLEIPSENKTLSLSSISSTKSMACEFISNFNRQSDKRSNNL